MRLLAVIVRIYLSMKQICHAGVPAATELSVWKPCEVPRPPCSSSTSLSVPTAFDDKCVICGTVQL